MAGVDDFDFFIGDWRVAHRQLKDRLAGSDEWVEFGGTTSTVKILGGQGNMDENLVDKPGNRYRAVTLRTFDPVSGQWAIWWFDARQPHQVEAPVVGRFENGVGTFYADDASSGRTVRCRFTWSRTGSGAPRWEQAFSIDDGASWETNWIMDFTRA